MSEHILVNDIRVPVQVKRSRRNLVRYSISSKSVNLSVPRYYIKHLIKKELAKFELWCLSQFESKPELLDRFKSRHYFNGQRIDIYGDSFILQIESKHRKSVAAKIQNNEIIISIPFGIEESEKHQSIGKVLSRTLSKYYINDITNRVHQLNNKYLQENIESVKLKNNRSNWGSCSSKRNINLSSRLLFAPSETIDYVIIHELAHLKEMNHSPKFWSIVSAIIPDYKKHERWLKINGPQLEF